MQQQVSLQGMSIDCLNTAKHHTIIDCINTLESANSQVRQAFSRLTQDHQSMADDWFRLMERRGWYQVPNARPEIRSQIANFVNSVQANMGQTFTSAAQPTGQFGYGTQTYGGSQYGYGQGGFGSQIYGQQSAAQHQGGMMSGSAFGSQQYLR